MNARLVSLALALTGLLAAAALAGCGSKSSDTTSSTQAGQTTTAATAPAAGGDKQVSSDVTGDPSSRQREIPVKDPAKTLRAGDLTVTVKVNKVADPVIAVVDEPQKGNKLVGIFLDTKATGVFEPAKVGAVATLGTTKGKVTSVRLIADGDCAGGFFPGGLLSQQKKQQTGCIGFEIPKDATPTSITLGIRDVKKGGQQATWTLPRAA